MRQVVLERLDRVDPRNVQGLVYREDGRAAELELPELRKDFEHRGARDDKLGDATRRRPAPAGEGERAKVERKGEEPDVAHLHQLQRKVDEIRVQYTIGRRGPLRQDLIRNGRVDEVGGHVARDREQVAVRDDVVRQYEESLEHCHPARHPGVLNRGYGMQPQVHEVCARRLS